MVKLKKNISKYIFFIKLIFLQLLKIFINKKKFNLFFNERQKKSKFNLMTFYVINKRIIFLVKLQFNICNNYIKDTKY